jgi:hypothetical protein
MKLTEKNVGDQRIIDVNNEKIKGTPLKMAGLYIQNKGSKKPGAFQRYMKARQYLQAHGHKEYD